MFTLFFNIISAAMLCICVFLFAFQTVRAVRFRNKIADTHGFTEGLMTGISYPMLIAVLSLIFTQFLLFLILPPSSELEICIRAALYIISIAVFFVFKRNTPALLAYWFGKTALWADYGENGKIPYSDIYCATLSRNVTIPLMNNQRLCKFSFYVKNKTVNGLPKRFTCRMTALEITALGKQVKILSHSEAKTVKKEQLKKNKLLQALPFVRIVSIASLAMLFMSYGVFFSHRYSPADFAKEKEINTVTEITSVTSNEENVCIYYGKINALSVYDQNGNFKFSVLLNNKPFAQTDIRINNGKIYYRYANNVHIYSSVDGTLSECSDIDKYSEIFAGVSAVSEYSTDKINIFKTNASGEKEIFIARPDYTYVFISVTSWISFIISIAAIFTLKYFLSDRTPPEEHPAKPKKNKKPRPQKRASAPKDDLFDEDETDITNEFDATDTNPTNNAPNTETQASPENDELSADFTIIDPEQN